MQVTTDEIHVKYMLQAVECANESIPVDTAYCVGCVIVKNSVIISTGYSRELPGNTHAEESALIKLNNAQVLRTQIRGIPRRQLKISCAFGQF